MIVITTPAGQIGRQVLSAVLEGAGAQPVRVIARDPGRLPQAARRRVEVIEGTHADPAVIGRAFQGADTVFWLVPADPRAASVQDAYVAFTGPAAEAFTRHGVRRVVGISALGRGTAMASRAGRATASLAADDLIAASGVAYRALTMPSFMDNTLRQVAVIKDKGMFFGPLTADRKAPACATRDIAAAAARLLLDDTWGGVAEQAILGPEDLSPNDMAQIMSEVLRFQVRYQQVPLHSYLATLTAAGMNKPMAESLADMAAAKNEGLDNAVIRTPENTTPTTFRQWCEEILSPALQAHSGSHAA